MRDKLLLVKGDGLGHVPFFIVHNKCRYADMKKLQTLHRFFSEMKFCIPPQKNLQIYVIISGGLKDSIPGVRV